MHMRCPLTVWSAGMLAVLLVPGVLPCLGCRGAPPRQTLDQAWRHSEAGNHGAAYPLVREYILRHPGDPLAHYLLGKCLVNRTPPELTRAKGQFDMARHLFDTAGSLSVLEEHMTASAFQATLHHETALVLLHTAMEAHKAGIPQHASLGVLRTALEHAKKGVYFDPNASALRDLQATLEATIRRIEGHHSPFYFTPEQRIS